MVDSKQQRIIFIDLMRALAVFMMVQGHTIDSFLAPGYKDPNSSLFIVWNYIRGFTAPIFMFSAGVAFTYLFRINGLSFKDNPRVKKGVKRFFLLLILAYILRFPTYRFFDYSDVTPAQWQAFFTVDALHLIAFGLLFIMLFIYLSEKLKINDIYLFIAGTIIFITLQIIFEQIRWTDFMHPFFAGYLYSGSGSLFPLFPWVGYLLCGAALGSNIAKNPIKVKNPRFGLNLIYIALIIFAFGKTLEQMKFALNWGEPFWVNAIYHFTLRSSVVIFLNGVMSLLVFRLDTIPKVVKLFGQHSLLIYVVHVVILYGNTWVAGLNTLLFQRFDLLTTLILVVVMLFLMAGMVLILDRIKKKTRKNAPVKKRENYKVELSEK